MFTRSCGESIPHAAHEFSHLWRRSELPFLRDPENYPDEWTAQYRCPGVAIGAAWNVVYMHSADCPECEACADSAIEHATKTGSEGHTWNWMIPVTYPEGVFAEVGHRATVERL